LYLKCFVNDDVLLYIVTKCFIDNEYLYPELFATLLRTDLPEHTGQMQELIQEITIHLSTVNCF